tara:strand:+ start:17333 stop:17743 length:411 start_codon:yes stop_codon:yes gene_type:complete
MEFDIRKLNSTDYDEVLVGWWKDWGWEPPAKDFLPDDGEGGFLVLDEDIPVCAGFIYVTNSKVAWVDWIISNKNYDSKKKKHSAVILLVDTLTNLAKNSGKKYSYALIKHKGLMGTYEKLGYIKADNYTQEMIKVL